MTTILIPHGKSFTAPEDIVFPIVTTVVPDTAFSSDISPVTLTFISASAVAKFVTHVSVEISGTPIPSTASLVTNNQAKVFSSVKTEIVIPKGAVISHDAPDTSKVYLAF